MADDQKQQEGAAQQLIVQEQKPVGKFNIEEIGASGTRLYGEVFDEEYLSLLTGTRRADIFDEMLRSDDVITMLLTARKNPILKANWKIEPAIAEDGNTDQEALYKKMAEHANHEFFERMPQDFKDFLEDALTMIEHGYSLFERVHQKVVDPSHGPYIGFKKLAWRSQRTIDYWKLDRSGAIEAVFQQADGDVGGNVYIDGRWVTVFSHRKRGDNYEGISALRPLYGNWQRKCVFLKLIAIGIERYAINTPVGKIPAGKEEGSERNKFISMLKAISSHQQNFFTLPQGWEVDFLNNPFDADKVVKVIQREDEGMVKSFVANHLNLGQGGSGGAYALGSDLSDQFLSIIENDADIIVRRFNKEIIKEFIDMNYGPQTSYPKMTVSGINDKFSKEFAEIMASLADKKYLTATENLEEWVREKMGLPALLEADAEAIPDVRKVEQASLFSEDSSSFDEEATYGEDEEIEDVVQLAGKHGGARDGAGRPKGSGGGSSSSDKSGGGGSGGGLAFKGKQSSRAANGQIKIKKPKTIDEASNLVSEANKYLNDATNAFEKDPKNFKKGMILDHTLKQHTRATNLAKRLTGLSDANEGIQFADQRKTDAKIIEQLDNSALVVAEGMQENLKLRAQAYIKRLFNEMAKVPKAQWRKIIRNQKPLPKLSDYNKKLKKALTETAGRAISQARNEVSGGRKVEFAEGVKSRMTFAESDDSFKNLPKSLQELITTSAELVTDSQFTDIEQAVLLSTNSGVDQTDDLRIIQKKAEDAVQDKLEGAGKTGFGSSIITGATNLTSKVYNTSRIEFFQVPEVLEKIEAFKFKNRSPVSPICQDLNGRIFAKNDPESAKYLPPLHHNCKSYIVPVFSLQGKQVSDIGLQPTDPKLNKFMTL